MRGLKWVMCSQEETENFCILKLMHLYAQSHSRVAPPAVVYLTIESKAIRKVDGFNYAEVFCTFKVLEF